MRGRVGGMPGWRYCYRLPLLLLLVVATVPAALMYLPPLGSLPAGGEPLRHRVLVGWSRLVVGLFGLRLRVRGRLRPGGQLVVANHLSWLDIEVLHAMAWMRFVAKADIRRWPLVGLLVSLSGTIYHQRGSSRSLEQVIQRMRECLAADEPLAIFPEGFIGDGQDVRRFHARGFKAAQLADVPVQPVCIRYLKDGKHNRRIPHRPDESFAGNLWRLLGEPPSEVEVTILAPLSPDLPRRELALATETAVRAAYHATDSVTDPRAAGA